MVSIKMAKKPEALQEKLQELFEAVESVMEYPLEEVSDDCGYQETWSEVTDAIERLYEAFQNVQEDGTIKPVFLNPYYARCADCAVLAAGEDGEWICDEKDRPIEKVETCPYGLPLDLRYRLRCEECPSLREWSNGDRECLECCKDIEMVEKCPKGKKL